MKILKIFFIIVTLSIPSFAAARDFVITISPYQTAQEAQKQAADILQFVTNLEAEDSAVFVDGYNLKTIGTFKVPVDSRYSSAKARLAVNKAGVGALVNFSKAAMPNVSGAAPRAGQALRLPQLLRYVAQNHSGGEEVKVIVFGSVFYDDPQEPAFSMADGLIPSDGHILSSREKTPFGAADTPNALKNLRVHVGYTDAMPSDRHAYYAERIWTLFVEHQGGKLVTFSSDQGSVFSRAKNKAAAPEHSFKLEESNKLEMIRLRTEVIQEQSIYQRPVSTTKPTAQTLHHARSVQIGLSWDCPSCDLDLYAQTSPRAERIFFGNSKTSEGTHLKDFLQSPRTINGYETIEFFVPVDLSQLKIAVNFFKGNAPQGIKGELRLAFDGNTYAMPFTLATTSGDSGRSVSPAFMNNTSNTAQTLFINALSIADL